MKKVLSVAMASAMVLGMGANAFAIEYGTGSNDKAEWPDNFDFGSSIFVTDKNGDIIKDSNVIRDGSESFDFQPGDTIWMPLYADNQVQYSATVTPGTEDKIGVNDIVIDEKECLSNADAKTLKATFDGTQWVNQKEVIEFWDGTCYGVDAAGNRMTTDWEKGKTYTLVKPGKNSQAVFSAPETVKVAGEDRAVSSIKVTVNGRTFTGAPETVEKKVNDYLETLKDKKLDVYLPVTFSGYASVKAEDGKGTTVENPESGDTTHGVIVERGHYTGKIDKNWSINLIETEGKVSDLIEKAELYKATKYDYASYVDHTTEIMPNAVYLKVTLKKEWKTIDTENLKYYVYLSNNKNSADKTGKVWVAGKYAAPYRTVDFTWSNNANEASLWKAEDNGWAVFDFADKAFFTVKMYKGETMYLDLNTAYNKILEGEFDAEFDSFYKFDNNANFAREGELVIVSDDENLVVYEVNEEEGILEPIDAEYVDNYLVKNTNAKVNGFKFNTKQLGNYVLSEELAEEEEVEEPAEEEEPTEEPEVEEPEVNEVPETNKPNPETGAEDFVGLAVSLAVVSVAAAGALALKK